MASFPRMCFAPSFATLALSAQVAGLPYGINRFAPAGHVKQDQKHSINSHAAGDRDGEQSGVGDA
jgi:hypothetical protein